MSVLRPVLTFLAIAGFVQSAFCKEIALEQSFDGLPVDAEGRFGSVGSLGSDTGGRWGTFGTDGKTPRNQDAVSQEGSAIELFRGDGDGRQVLLGLFGALPPVREIDFDYSLMIPDQGGASVVLGHINEPTVGLMINQQGTSVIKAWDGVAKAWVPVVGHINPGEWLRVKMKCSAVTGVYSVQVYDSAGTELAGGEFPLQKASLLQGGINNVVVSPQFAGPIYFDNPLVQVEP